MPSSSLNRLVVPIGALHTDPEGAFYVWVTSDPDFLVEKRLVKDRHYTSTNRWVPTKEIKNGYVVNSRHTTLISDAHALDMIVF